MHVYELLLLHVHVHVPRATRRHGDNRRWWASLVVPAAPGGAGRCMHAPLRRRPWHPTTRACTCRRSVERRAARRWDSAQCAHARCCEKVTPYRESPVHRAVPEEDPCGAYVGKIGVPLDKHGRSRERCGLLRPSLIRYPTVSRRLRALVQRLHPCVRYER